MITVFASLIAVAGTLLGSVAAFVFQRQMADRTAVHAFAERMRQDRLRVYSTFAEVATQYRQAEVDRWRCYTEDPGGDSSRLARAEAYRHRAALRNSLLHVQLLMDDPHLHELGDVALEKTRMIHEATNEDEMHVKADEALAAIQQFIRQSAIDIQTPTLPRSRRREVASRR